MIMPLRACCVYCFARTVRSPVIVKGRHVVVVRQGTPPQGGTWRTMEAISESSASSDGGHALSSLPFTCADDVCPPFAGTIPTKYDQTHLTVAYAEHIAPALQQALDAMGLLE